MDFRKFTKTAPGSPEPVYVIGDSDAYLRRRVLEFCRNLVEESARSFDWSVHDLSQGDSETKKRLMQETVGRARTLPWMSPYRWVYVKGAEQGREALDVYIKDPSDRTVLILETDRKVRAWSKLPQIELPRGSAATWVQQYAGREGFVIDPRAAERLVELVGEDHEALRNGLEKLFLWVLDSKRITVDSVMDLTMDTRERNVFDLIGTLADRRSREALRLLNRILEDGGSEVQLTGMLYWGFSRLLVAHERVARGDSYRKVLPSLKLYSMRNSEAQLRKYTRERLVELLLRLRGVDRLTKTSSADPRIQLERLIVDTCREPSV